MILLIDKIRSYLRHYPLFDFRYLGRDLVVFGVVTGFLILGLPYSEEQKGFQFLNLPGRLGFPGLPGVILALILISLFALAIYLFGVSGFPQIDKLVEKNPFPFNILSAILSAFDPRLFHPFIWVVLLAGGVWVWLWSTPARACLEGEVVLVHFHIEQIGGQSATDKAPDEIFFAEPNADYELEVVAKHADGDPLPAINCDWKDGGFVTQGQLRNNSGCTVRYHSGQDGKYDPLEVVLTEPGCPPLPPYSFFIINK
jgi:hypothetical protein